MKIYTETYKKGSNKQILFVFKANALNPSYAKIYFDHVFTKPYFIDAVNLVGLLTEFNTNKNDCFILDNGEEEEITVEKKILLGRY